MLMVLSVYGALALLNSTGGYLGTDTGAKVITLDRMADGNTFNPAVGYWAEEWDPDGLYHPLLDTLRNEDGEWVNVTTLPMLVAALPLYELGGYRLALLLPMAGALLAAFACRSVVRELSGEREGWAAFWCVALASPMAIYALDLWEHSLGAGLMVAAFAVLLRALRNDAPPWLPLLAGLALGASATMRTESFVAAATFVGGTCLALATRRRVRDALTTGVLSTVGFAVPWLLNSRLEDALGGNSRAGRASGVAAGVGAPGRDWSGEAVERTREALITWFGLPNADYPLTVLLGVLIGMLLVASAALVARGERRSAVTMLVVVSAVYLLSVTSGLGFVPGALVATPVAVMAAVGTDWTGDRWVVVAVAISATVLTWMFQYTGGALPQWGGRYILTPTLLLLCLGIVALHEHPALLRRGVFTIAALVTVMGLAWLQVRSHAIDTLFDEVAELPGDVVISTNGFFVREAGPAYEVRRYLSIGRGGSVAGAVDVAIRSGAETYAVLSGSREAPETGDPLTSSAALEVLGATLWYHTFEVR